MFGETAIKREGCVAPANIVCKLFPGSEEVSDATKRLMRDHLESLGLSYDAGRFVKWVELETTKDFGQMRGTKKLYGKEQKDFFEIGEVNETDVLSNQVKRLGVGSFDFIFQACAIFICEQKCFVSAKRFLATGSSFARMPIFCEIMEKDVVIDLSHLLSHVQVVHVWKWRRPVTEEVKSSFGHHMKQLRRKYDGIPTIDINTVDSKKLVVHNLFHTRGGKQGTGVS